MSREEIEASKGKLGLRSQEPNPTQPHGEECGKNACSNTAVERCRFCNRPFCTTHLDPSLAESHREITNLTHHDYVNDPELYNKRINDWNRPDGHPCAQYTVWWMRKHDEKIKAQIPTYSWPPYSDVHEDPSIGERMGHTQSADTHGAGQRHSMSNTTKVSAVLLVIAAIALIVIAVPYLTRQTTGSGAYSSPYNTKMGWQGAGYYRLNGVEYYVASETNLYTTSTSSSSTTSTSTSTTTVNPTILDSEWAANFFANVSAERGSGYAYCPSLSQFAAKRFSTMAANYGISHYGYDQDFQSFYGGIYNTAFGEEVFYPSGYSPSDYLSQIQSTAILHWQLLSNSTFTVYGYYLGNGPTYEIYGPDGGYGGVCPVTEIPGPNINIQQYFQQYGCSVVTANDTWFVIEIASNCPAAT